MRQIALAGTALMALLPPAVLAQSNPTYIRFDPRPVKAVLYRPDSGPVPHVAIGAGGLRE